MLLLHILVSKVINKVTAKMLVKASRQVWTSGGRRALESGGDCLINALRYCTNKGPFYEAELFMV